MIDVGDGHRFSQHLLERLLRGSGRRLGDLFLASKKAFPQNRYGGVVLVCDPALVVQPE